MVGFVILMNQSLTEGWGKINNLEQNQEVLSQSANKSNAFPQINSNNQPEGWMEYVSNTPQQPMQNSNTQYKWTNTTVQNGSQPQSLAWHNYTF